MENEGNEGRPYNGAFITGKSHNKMYGNHKEDEGKWGKPYND